MVIGCNNKVFNWWSGKCPVGEMSCRGIVRRGYVRRGRVRRENVSRGSVLGEVSVGDLFGRVTVVQYFINVQKPKEDVTRHAPSVFKQTKIRVTWECQEHPGAVIGSKKFWQNYVQEILDQWIKWVSFAEKNCGVIFKHHILVLTKISNKPSQII